MSVTHYNGKKLYKVLVNGKSCHGGDFTWSLPTQNADGTWTPGDWTPEVEANLCSSGYHATWEPIKWANQPNIEVYEVEFDDAVTGSEDSAKVVGNRCRLLSRVVDAAVLLSMHIVVSGSHEVNEVVQFLHGKIAIGMNRDFHEYDRDDARELIPVLQHFVDTGVLPRPRIMVETKPEGSEE